MRFRERCDVLGGSVYDCCDCGPDYFDYDGPEDFGHCSDEYRFVGLCRDIHDPGDCEACCVSRGDAGVMPYESGTGGSSIDENIIAFRPTGSNQPVNCVLGAAYPGIPYEEDGRPGPSPVS